MCGSGEQTTETAKRKHGTKNKNQMKNYFLFASLVMLAVIATVFACSWLVALLRTPKHIGKSNRIRVATRNAVVMFIYGVQTILALPAEAARRMRYGPTAQFANIAEGVHGDGHITKLTDAAIATRYFLVEKGTDSSHVSVSNSAADIPLGVCTDEAAAAEAYVDVALVGVATGTLRCVAGGNITMGDLIVSNGDGKVKTLPATTGTYYIIGRALADAVADDVIEFAHCFPTQRVVA